MDHDVLLVAIPSFFSLLTMLVGLVVGHILKRMEGPQEKTVSWEMKYKHILRKYQRLKASRGESDANET